MAQHYEPADSYRTVQVLVPGVPLQVEEIGFFTLPSRIYARVALPEDLWEEGEFNSKIDAMAVGIEATMDDAEVIDMYFEQDISAAGLLIDQMVIVVQVPPTRSTQPGPFRGEVRAPTYAFEGQARDYLVNPKLAAEVQRLRNLAAA